MARFSEYKYLKFSEKKNVIEELTIQNAFRKDE